MNDLIDRQAAIEIATHEGAYGYISAQELSELPSAQPDNSALKRAETLLRATYQLLMKQNDSGYVLNLLSETIYYDEAECDGCCLMDDIKYWFDEFLSEDIDDE